MSLILFWTSVSQIRTDLVFLLLVTQWIYPMHWWQTSIEQVPYIQTFKLQTFKNVNVLALHLLLLMVLQFHHLLPSLPPPVSNSSYLFTGCQPLYASCWTTLLYSSRYYATTAAAAKSLQSCPILSDPWTVAHQTPLSMGFSRQEYWSGLPFPSPMHESEKWKWSHSVMFNS